MSGFDGDSAIRYAVVANWGAAGKPQLLAEVCSCTVMNVPHITKIILEKMKSEDHKLSYTYDKFLFHIIVWNKICFLCMADQAFDRRVPFEFLENVKEKFHAKYSDRWSTVTTVKELRDFTGELSKQLEIANSGSEDKIRQTKRDIDTTKQVIEDGIESLLGRGEKIDILVEKADELDQGARAFRVGAKKIHWATWKKKCMMTSFFVFLALLVIFIIVLIACGGFTFKKCK